jgi:hypothetical protein
MYSKNAMFEVEVKETDDKDYEWTRTKDDRLYVVVENELTFFIKIIALKNVNDVYGAKLYIDGELINHQKTFKKKGTFFGVKQGGGVYKKFTFKIPNLENPSNAQSRSHTDVNDSFGVIKIIIFHTKPIWAKKKIKKFHRKIELTPCTREENKKFFMRSLTIAEGEKFTVKNTYRDFLKRTGGDFHQEHIIDENDIIDEIKINYADFIALQVMGVVKKLN